MLVLTNGALLKKWCRKYKESFIELVLFDKLVRPVLKEILTLYTSKLDCSLEKVLCAMGDFGVVIFVILLG
jgi:hypothetical protein